MPEVGESTNAHLHYSQGWIFEPHLPLTQLMKDNPVTEWRPVSASPAGAFMNVPREPRQRYQPLRFQGKDRPCTLSAHPAAQLRNTCKADSMGSKTMLLEEIGQLQHAHLLVASALHELVE
jgi:hypothetical protein